MTAKDRKSPKAHKSKEQEPPELADAQKAIKDLGSILSGQLVAGGPLVKAWAEGQKEPHAQPDVPAAEGQKEPHTQPDVPAKEICRCLRLVAAALLSVHRAERARLEEDIIALFSPRMKTTSGTETMVIREPFIRFAWDLIKGPQPQPELVFWAYDNLIKMCGWQPEDFAVTLERHLGTELATGLEIMQRVCRAAIAEKEYGHARRVVSSFSQNVESRDFSVEAAVLYIEVLAAEGSPKVMRDYAKAVIEELNEKGNFEAIRRIEEALPLSRTVEDADDPPDPDIYIDTEEAAQLLDCTERTIRNRQYSVALKYKRRHYFLLAEVVQGEMKRLPGKDVNLTARLTKNGEALGMLSKFVGDPVEIDPKKGVEPARFERLADELNKKIRKLADSADWGRGLDPNRKDDVASDVTRVVLLALCRRKEHRPKDLAGFIRKTVSNLVAKDYENRRRDRLVKRG